MDECKCHPAVAAVAAVAAVVGEESLRAERKTGIGEGAPDGRRTINISFSAAHPAAIALNGILYRHICSPAELHLMHQLYEIRRSISWFQWR